MGVVGNRYLIVNPRAPVRAYRKYHEEEVKDFRDLAEFEAWYSPGYHVIVPPPRTCYLFTDVLLENIDDPPGNRPRSFSKGVERTPPGARPVGAIRRHHHVEVEGVVYNSVYRAFEALGLPIDAHVKFRGRLKQAGTLAFEHGGRAYGFKIIEG